MAAPQVRSDYDQLQVIQNTFSAQSDALQRMNQNLKSRMDTLQGGDWIGEGAKKFYGEMNDQVIPSLRRFEKAMSEAARITQQISRIMKQAEDEASGIFKL
ncbi:MAG: WXG100 family type VII secretion target [Chloroflexota bacterium]